MSNRAFRFDRRAREHRRSRLARRGEEWDEAELRAQLDLNFVAAAELSRVVISQMRAQGRGHIMEVTSVAGIRGCAAYCASKFALDGWSVYRAAILTPRTCDVHVSGFCREPLGMLILETVARVRREFFAKGKSIKEIVRDLGMSRNTVRKVLRSGETVFSYERSVQPLPKLGRGRQI